MHEYNQFHFLLYVIVLVRAITGNFKKNGHKNKNAKGIKGFALGACFSKVPKLFGPISGATIPFISLQSRGCKPSNFAIL